MRRLLAHVCGIIAQMCAAEDRFWTRLGCHRLAWHAFCAFNYWDLTARRYSR